MSLSILIRWVVVLQKMWLGMDIPYEPINIVNAREFVSHMGDVAVELGYVSRNQYVPVHIVNPQPKLPQYTQIVNAGLDPTKIYEILTGMNRPPPNWRGGTSRCSNVQIIFNPAWLSPTWLFYGSPTWMSIAAHERAHINQGCKYYHTVEGEQLASLMGFHMLGASNRPETHIALVAGLREIAIAALVVQTNDDWILDSLELTDGERKYFDSILDQCQTNREYCLERSEQYWIGPLRQMELVIEPGTVVFVIPDLSQEIK